MNKLVLAFVAMLSFVSSAAHAVPPPAYQENGGAEPTAIPSTYDVDDFMYNPGGVASLYDPAVDGNEAAFRTICEFTHMAYDDPLIFPGQPGASHLHMFAGNPTTDADSTYTSLRAAANNPALASQFRCAGGPNNASAYWHPAILKDDVECDADHPGTETCAVKPRYYAIYYKLNRGNVNGVYDTSNRIPRGFGYVFGFNMATGQRDENITPPLWSCTNGNSSNYLANADGTAALDCPASEELIGDLVASNCWNGVDLTTPNGRTHVVFQTGGAYNAPCPGSHPYRIAVFQIKIIFNHEGTDDIKTWYLASDRMPGYPVFRNGESLHADWFGGWDYNIMLQWQNHCDGLGGLSTDVKSCSDSAIGDGTSLSNAAGGITFEPVEEADRYLKLPVDPAVEEDPVEGHKTGTNIRPPVHGGH